MEFALPSSWFIVNLWAAPSSSFFSHSFSLYPSHSFVLPLEALAS
jgi:hypothetical protein